MTTSRAEPPQHRADPGDRSAAEPLTGDQSATAELLEQVAAGQLAAFNQLYDANRVWVYRTAVAILRDQSQAEEVTQEVLAEIWRCADRFDATRGSAAGWIRRLANSRAVDRVRHAQSVRAMDHRYHRRHIPPEVDCVVEQVLRNADAADLHRALNQLTALQRQALLITYLQDLSNEQASTLLGIPVPTLKSRVLSALTSLRRARTQGI